MSDHDAPEPWVQPTIQRGGLGRLGFVVLLALALLLLLFGKADIGAVRYLRERLNDTLTPVLAVAQQPLQLGTDVTGGIGEMLALKSENARLREDNARLRAWQTTAHRLSLENAALRDQLNVERPVPIATEVTTRVIADPRGPYVNSVLVNAGAEQGVRVGMPAVNREGLVGRVIHVGRHSARVLLLTDYNSRIPVMTVNRREPAILTGDNSDAPQMRFLPLNPRLNVGDRVVTSGSGGLIPQGLPVGVVNAMNGETAVVAPYVDWRRLDYVRLLDFPPIEPPDTSLAQR